MSRLDNFLEESDRRTKINLYLARKERERKELAHSIAVLIVLGLYALAWLAGTALIALVLSFTIGHLAWWQWCLVIFVVGIAAGRVASWFKRGEK
jgi:MFS family permease